MADLQASWARTRAHFAHAESFATEQDLAAFREHLAHNELELAADVLRDVGDECERLPRAFWDALGLAYEEMGLAARKTFCQYRAYEAEHGFIEATLTLLSTEQGGRTNSISTDYRPDWNIGRKTESGEIEINGARVTLEDCAFIAPGGSGLVRLHPTWKETWFDVRTGDHIDMHEGARVKGRALVLRVTLR